MSNLIGQSLGRYHILEQLGEGGMATVYKARDLNLERDVAIKVIRTDIFGSAILERMLKRFQREGRALGKLTHPNIVPILDFGEHNGAPYLVMPYLPGGTLKQRMQGQMPYRDAVQMLIPVAQALVHAHQQGVIHRDVKPANILVTRTGELMLSDFGIARIIDAEETRDLTSTGVGIGTPEYMAPEQGMGQADERSDIYALGIVLYEMVTGRIPFRANTPMAVLLKKSQEPLPHPREFAPNLPQAVENVLIKALAREPGQRYQSAQEFLNALERLLHDETVTVEMPRPKKNNFTWIAAGIGGLIFLAVCGIGLFAVSRLAASESQPTAAPYYEPQAPPMEPTLPVAAPAASTDAPLPTSAPEATAVNVPAAGEVQINPMDQAEIVYIPAATFVMGLTNDQAQELRPYCDNCDLLLNASRPRHKVTLDAYWIYKTEVSNAMYQKCVIAGYCLQLSKNESDAKNNRLNYHTAPEYANYPVSHATWEMAETYCEWAVGRLPTEAQWEFAARGPDGNLYPWGNQLPSSSLANLAKWLSPPDTESVNSYPSGASYFGLLNMAGNVWEWAYDWFQADYYQTNTSWINPTGPSSGDIIDGKPVRSGRGGNYWTSHGFSNAVLRDWDYYDRVGSAVGFRCALPTQ